jgi:tetratricopeptide (TPR) repeat protein
MNLRLRFITTFALATIVLAAGPAAAQEDALNRAREHFDRGQTLYAQGTFLEAAEEFKKAFQARAFPQFLFNTGACYEKALDYQQAVSFYRRYLEAEPDARDKKETERRIQVLEAEIERIKSQPPPPDPDPDDPDAPKPDPDDPDAPGPTPTPGPSAQVAALGDVRIRGFVVIESDPPNATIYLNSKKSKPLSRTPWNGTLEGEHTLFIEREGYKPIERKISPSADKLMVLYFGLAEEDYLGWLRISANVPGAEIYLDRKEIGVFQRTPWQGNVEPGVRKIWITKEGYDEFYTEIDIIRGQTHEVDAQLSGSPVGYVNVRGEVDQASVYVDGELLCERGPCRKPVPEGSRTITIRRPGYKPYTRHVDLQAKTEVTIRPQLAKRPGRTDAIVSYVFGGVFIGAGVWAGLEAQKIRDGLREDVEAGMPPPDADDSRFTRALIYSIGADAAYAIGTVSLLMAVYYTFRDKGPPSTGSADVRSIAVEPQFSPNYVGLEVSW